ncbi:hypothetical protein CAOG_08505 [Capsaspora owczarzaki ATCC 30864]|uniref:peptidylprolyl isomerase n=1 Tax=Capsaspora owczarzaki (strain ATCC 30864) TaxID=595528 RepID=A0A0D2VJ93_CAPO3|nr:hypothetical protein CAOG_08505 [Capsaspora owczarzaki ATCC 30864]KJE90037.1 hypothetical protein CAOG_008505 [Capsaspora owczarzaki ATCC 30864]|eukprot:XP_011270087.1 hypothetical protein CAOG_08505 [Capsaspora owczarzaki ATCC 30864]
MTTRARKTTTGDSGVEVQITPDGQVTKIVLRDGTGAAPPPKGSLVTVHYVGRTPDGRIFDQSRNHGSPFEFKLGAGYVIKGWDSGVATMKVGEKALLSCGSNYAYGADGINDGMTLIPPNATLEFEVELLSWREDKSLPILQLSIVLFVALLAWYILWFEPSQRATASS